MKVLVVGGGGREHALAWGLAKSPTVTELWTTSGNGGICQLARCVDVETDGIKSLADWATAQAIDLTVVGPEAQLTVGIVDEFTSRGLAIMGPTRAAAELESSKAFAKEIMAGSGVPTARFVVCESPSIARQAVRDLGYPVVIKADGLAAGKGVVICHLWDEADQAIARIMEEGLFGEAGERVVVEEFLVGEEVSSLAFVSGEDIVMMPTAQDHKAVYDGDRGPNTGGMGAYSPVPGLASDFSERVRERVMEPVVAAMAKAGRPYSGVLYAGLMMTAAGLRVLEFNCRFGDPETQVLIPRLESDLCEVLHAVATGRLRDVSVRWSSRPAVCVVLASEGYPGDYEVGVPISGLDVVAKKPSVQVFHAGTAVEDGQLVTAGGRVLGVTAWDQDVRRAVDRVYDAVRCVDFPGMQYRRDIAHRALG